MAADNLLTPSIYEAWTEGQEQKWPLARIRTGVRTATLALALGVGSAQAQQQPTEPVQWPILIAQANVEDGRRWPYTAFIPQVNSAGKVVEIKFYRDKNGLIIPLPIENGKLVDGSDAPSDPLRAKIAQRKIIAQYDPLILVKTEKTDLLLKASKDIKQLYILAEQGKLTKEQLYESFYNAYLMRLWLAEQATTENIEGFKKIINGLESYWKIKLNLQPTEIQTIKQRAEVKAKEVLERFSSSAA